MGSATLVDHGAPDTRIEHGDEEGERAASRQTRTADSTLVHLGPGEQVIDGPHAVPDAVMGQVFSDQEQEMARHGMFPGAGDEAVLGLVGLRVPILAALALPDWVVREHDKTFFDQT